MTNNTPVPDFVDVETNQSDEKIMSWIGHLSELRSRLLKVFVFFLFAFGLAYPFVDIILEVLLSPLANAMQVQGGSNRIIFTGLAEGFLSHIKIALFAGILLSFPFLIFQIWQFIKYGLYEKERRFVRLIMIFCPVLFCCGALFVFFILMPLAFKFLLSFQTLASKNALLPIVLEAKLNEYISLLIQLILAFGLSFQLPVVLIILGKIGLIRSESLKHFRRYAIVFVFILAAILTPPDAISQVILALPLLFLYEVSIYTIQFLEKK